MQFVSILQYIRDLSLVLMRLMTLNVLSAVADDIAYVDRRITKQLMELRERIFRDRLCIQHAFDNCTFFELTLK